MRHRRLVLICALVYGLGGAGCGAKGGGTEGSGGSGAGGTTSGSGGTTTGAGGAHAAGGATGSGGASAGSGGSGATTGAGGSGAGGAGGAHAAGGATGTGGVTGGGGAGGATTGAGGATTGAGGSGAGGAGVCATAALSATAAARTATEYQSWKTGYVVDCPSTSSAYVDKGGGSAVSEGIGYGMLLSVANNDQTLFDKLWKFYTDHLDTQGLMNWSMSGCAPPGNNNANAATDGDLDAAMALVQADARWGGYTSAAQNLIGKIKMYETDSCNGLNVLRPGDKFGGCSDPGNQGKVNPSYFAPGYYRVFATIDTANAAFWTKLAADSYTMLAEYQALMSGLVPEWGFVTGTTDGSSYGYNACRTPWRVAVDYYWNCTPEARTFLQGVTTYVDGHGGVAGVPFDKNSAFLGGFALSAMPFGQTKLDGYVSAWLGAQVDDTPYFQATLRRLYLQLAAGQFTRP
jgi:endo-1,4-beta-D-glucanase Y